MPRLNVEQWDRLNRLFQKELASFFLKEWKNDGAIPGFLDLSTVDNLNQIILCCEGCPEHYKMFSIIPGLYPPETNSITPVMTIKNVKTLQNCLWSRTTRLAPTQKYFKLFLSSFWAFQLTEWTATVSNMMTGKLSSHGNFHLLWYILLNMSSGNPFLFLFSYCI